jgi:predicted DNA-binding transcriptional regulator AlpA
MSPATQSPPAALQLLTARDVAAALKIHVGSVWRMAALARAKLPCGDFPAPLSISPKVIRWRAADVERYLDALAGAAVQP